MNNTHSAGEFYGGLAADYDAMTGFPARLETALRFARATLDRYGGNDVLDTATGTGLYAIAFAQAGAGVTGTDLSAEMLEQAAHNARATAVEVTWQALPMEAHAALGAARFDLITCLGNSLPHLLTDELLDSTLAGFYRLLRPGGTLLLQLLNYEKVLAGRERLVSADRHGDQEFIRFYDFPADGSLLFNVLSLHWTEGRARHDWSTVPLRPYRAEELVAALSARGFAECAAFGSLGFAPFVQAASETVLITAKRKE